MASQEQIDANRRNAKKSCGPKSARGKQLVRLNAVKHGLRAEHVVLPGEDREEFEDLCRNLYEGWQPVGIREILLLDEIVDGRWLLQRVRIIRSARTRKEYETLERARAEEIVDVPLNASKMTIRQMVTFKEEYRKYKEREELRKSEENPHDVLDKYQDELTGDDHATDAPLDPFTTLAVAYRRSAKDLELLSRYEGAILRRLRNAERELERLQEARKSSTAKAPTVIDVTELSEGEN
jgi:hypothetical protein